MYFAVIYLHKNRLMNHFLFDKINKIKLIKQNTVKKLYI